MPLYESTELTYQDNPKIGEIRRAKDIGFTNKRYYYIWSVCEECGTPRWVRMISRKNGKPLNTRCRKCCGMHANENPQWKGGRFRRPSDGYVFLKIDRKSFFKSMGGKNGYVMEHRLVMAQSLGRCLQKWEKVHHKNGDKADNRIENLELTTLGSHALRHNQGYKDGYKQGLTDGRIKQIEELKQEIRLLQLQVKELREVKI